MKILPLLSTSFLILSSSLFADEPLPKGEFQITGVNVKAIDRVQKGEKILDQESEKLTYWIRFDVHPLFVKIAGSEARPHRVINPVIAENSTMTLDKPVKFNGKEVPAGTNLLDFKKFDGSRFSVSMPTLTPLAIHSARITSGFEIPKDTYLVTFEWKTAEDEIFKDTVKVEIDVDLTAKR